MTKRRGWQREQLAYCSNVHPGESLDEVYDNLHAHSDAVRRQCGLARMRTGLWLSAAAAGQLANDDAELQRFRATLAELNLDLVTVNGFPYGDFHADSVKQAVYQPDWGDPLRLVYTVNLATILTACLPSGHPGGSISTLPLGFSKDWSDARLRNALNSLCAICLHLEQLYRTHRVPVRLCLEMEPGCVLESTTDVIEFFKRDLRPAAREVGIDQGTLHRHLGVCFDVCHQAVQFEDVYESLRRLREANIPVGKIQLSSALTATDSPASKAALAEFCEPRYLHQTRARTADGVIKGVDDLPDALTGALPDDSEWRVHFHLPLQTGTLRHSGLGTTRGAVEKVLDWLKQPESGLPHLEVETYTWHVLPEALRPTDDASLHRGIAAELAWASGALKARGLLLES